MSPGQAHTAARRLSSSVSNPCLETYPNECTVYIPGRYLYNQFRPVLSFLRKVTLNLTRDAWLDTIDLCVKKIQYLSPSGFDGSLASWWRREASLAPFQAGPALRAALHTRFSLIDFFSSCMFKLFGNYCAEFCCRYFPFWCKFSVVLEFHATMFLMQSLQSIFTLKNFEIGILKIRKTLTNILTTALPEALNKTSMKMFRTRLHFAIDFCKSCFKELLLRNTISYGPVVKGSAQAFCYILVPTSLSCPA